MNLWFYARCSALAVPGLTELRRHESIVRDRRGDQSARLGERVQAVNCFQRNRCVVERRVARDQVGDQRRLLGPKQPLADRGGARWIGLERVLRLDDGAYRTSGDVGLLDNEPFGRGQRREIVEARSGRAVAAAQIEVKLGDAGAMRTLSCSRSMPACVNMCFRPKTGAASDDETRIPFNAATSPRLTWRSARTARNQ